MREVKRVALIGGGLVGLSTAYALTKRHPDLHIDVYEKEDRVSTHQSGRNSGVIHSGIYYAPGSLKARLCRTGRERLVEFCRQERIRYDICGKVIVAVSPEETTQLDTIFARGQENGVRCSVVSPDELQELEPHARGLKGIHVPDAGIVDYPGVARRLCAILEEQGHTVRLGSPVDRLAHESDHGLVTSGSTTESYDLVIACAGLHSDRLARMAGATTDFQIVPFRGVYYELKPERRDLCRNLIYPVPNPAYPFLGVHFTRMIDGRVEVGPNAVLATSREGYTLATWSGRDLLEAMRFPGFRRLARNHWKMGVTELHRTVSRRAYAKAIQSLVPGAREGDLIPCRSGIRAQALRKDGSMVDDFVIVEQPNMVHVCNAPSPAATACLSIGEYIADRVRDRIS